jgi:DNA-binding transcriptional LysR family regulator
VGGFLIDGKIFIRIVKDELMVRVGNLVQSEIEKQGLHRRIGLEVPTFLAGLFAVASSDLLMNAPLPLVDEAAKLLKLAVRDAPIRLPGVCISLCWHERFQGDAAHRWIHNRIFDVARSAFGGAALA